MKHSNISRRRSSTGLSPREAVAIILSLMEAAGAVVTIEPLGTRVVATARVTDSAGQVHHYAVCASARTADLARHRAVRELADSIVASDALL